MTRAVLTITTFLSVVFFPWKFTAILAVAASLKEPLVPLAAGILTDVLYYTPQVHAVPLFTIYGAIFTSIAFALRTWTRTGIIGK